VEDEEGDTDEAVFVFGEVLEADEGEDEDEGVM